MSSRLVVVVSGSRRLRTAAHRTAIHSYLKRFWRQPFVHVVVLHGAQAGADSIADSEAMRLGFDRLGIPYFKELDEPRRQFYPGGPKRNECVIDIARVLKDTRLYRAVMGAFPDDESTGTWRAVEYAAKHGIIADVFKQ